MGLRSYFQNTLYVAGDERDQRTVFIRNLPYTVTKDKVAEMFEGCTDVRLPLDDEGSAKG